VKKHLLITGSTRSGSTYVGRVISKSIHYSYLPEPCNCKWGIQGISHFYPYPSSFYKNLFDDFFNLNYKFKTGPKRNPIRYIIKKTIGNKNTMAGQYYKYISNHFSNMLLKDPNAAFLSDYFHEKHNVYVLVLVRHPMAFANSQKRMGWRFDFNDFLFQKELIKDYLSEEKDLMSLKLNYDEECGFLWHCIYKVLHDYNEKHRDSKRWMVIRHEDICLEPDRAFKDICDFVGITMGKRMKAFIKQTTNDSVIQPGNNQYIHLYRDARKLAYNWKHSAIQQQVESIKAYAGKTASNYYSDSTWAI